jgi:hypothetical protein
MHIETLENRRLFAANVSEAYPGYYEIHGDSGDDTVSITVNQNNATFTLDGATYSNVSYLYIHTYGGADFITVTSEDGYGAIGASVSAGEDDDTVMLYVDGAIWGGSGNDVLYLVDAAYGEIYGESGDDQLYIAGYCADPDISGGSGDDYIDASGNYGGVAIYGDSGADEIHGTEYDDHIDGGAGFDVMHGHGGNDVFYTRDANHDEIHGGAGIDIAYVDADGDDTFEVEYQLIG